MIIYFYGNRGSGKTLSSVILTDLFKKIYEKNKQKPLVFTNIDMKLKNFDMLDYFEEQYQNNKIPKIFLFDEIDKYSDSRRSMSLVNLFISYSMSLSRKTNTDFIMTSQIEGALDIRIRKFCDLIINPSYNKKTYQLKWDIFNQNNSNLSKVYVKNPKKYYTEYDTNYLTINMIKNDLKKFKILTKDFKSNTN